VVVWETYGQTGSEDSDVFGRLFDGTGVPASAEFRINSYTDDDQSAPAVAAASDGSFVVVWQSFGRTGDADWDVFGQRFDGAGAPLGTEFRVNTYITGNQQRPTVAVATDGHFVIAWQSDGQSGGLFDDVLARAFDATGLPLGPELQVNGYSPGDQGHADVASAGADFIVVWDDDNHDGSGCGVFAQRITASGLLVGTEIAVNSYTTDDQFSPAVSASADGSFVVVWQSDSHDGGLFTDIFARRFAGDGSPVGIEQQLNDVMIDDQQAPDIATMADGSFVATWESYPFDRAFDTILAARRFDANGSPNGTQFQVNTSATGSQHSPSITGIGSSGFVIAWESEEAEGGPDSGVVAIVDRSGNASCGDPTGDTSFTATDALEILKAAVGATACLPCVCDVDQLNGVKATDALQVLRFAVGQAVSFNCPAC